MNDKQSESNIESRIPSFDLTRQYREIKEEIDRALAGVLANGNFILGDEVAGFENEFARYLGVKCGVGVAEAVFQVVWPPARCSHSAFN